MIDIGLLLTGIAVWAVVAATSRWAARPAGLASHDVVDVLLGPALAGLVTARAAYVAVDDPEGLRSLQTLLVVRGGVEFWAGAVAFVAALAVGLRRRKHRHVDVAMAELAPVVLWAYAAFEAACLLRDGCYGPVAAVGFVPDGLRSRMFPVGLAVAGVVVALATLVRVLWRWTPVWRVLFAVGGLAAIRAVAAVWLPHVGDGPPREQVESAAVAGLVAAAALATAAARMRRRRGPAALAQSEVLSGEATSSPLTSCSCHSGRWLPASSLSAHRAACRWCRATSPTSRPCPSPSSTHPRRGG